MSTTCPEVETVERTMLAFLGQSIGPDLFDRMAAALGAATDGTATVSSPDGLTVSATITLPDGSMLVATMPPGQRVDA